MTAQSSKTPAKTGQKAAAKPRATKPRTAKPAAAKPASAAKPVAAAPREPAAPTTEVVVEKATPVAAPAATVVEEAKPVVTRPMLKKPELVDRIVAASGLKKKDVKPVVEATLTELARSLLRDEEMNLPPLGKISINRVKDVANARVMVVKLRIPEGGGAARDPLAAAAE